MLLLVHTLSWIPLSPTRQISYERAGVKNNWLQWVGRPEEQEQQQEQERRNQPHGRSEKGSANPGEAGLDADDRFGIDARSIEVRLDLTWQ